MTHASLFSGIGGFDLAAEWAGWTNVFNCEIDSFCRKVLKYHFPDAEQYEDIKKIRFQQVAGPYRRTYRRFPLSTVLARRKTQRNR